MTKIHLSEKWLMRCKGLLLIVAIIIMFNMSGDWIARHIDFQIYPGHESYLYVMLLGFFLLYISLMSLPFMPGIEVGLALMLFLGSKGAILVYFCTLIALIISFLIGRITSPLLICRLLNWLHLYKASALIEQLIPLDGHLRLELLQRKAPKRIAPFLLRHRYLTILILINLPGNALIGGGRWYLLGQWHEPNYSFACIYYNYRFGGCADSANYLCPRALNGLTEKEMKIMF